MSPKAFAATVTRKASTPIVVRVLPDEKAAIDAHARATGHSTSAFLRKVGLGVVPRSLLDQSRVGELAALGAELSRLRQVLEWWRDDDARLKAYAAEEQRRLLGAALAAVALQQAKLTGLLERVVHGSDPTSFSG